MCACVGQGRAAGARLDSFSSIAVAFARRARPCAMCPWPVLGRDRACGMRRVEKYRPQTLDDVVGNEDAVQRLRSIAQDGNMPHMILTVKFSGSVTRMGEPRGSSGDALGL